MTFENSWIPSSLYFSEIPKCSSPKKYLRIPLCLEIHKLLTDNQPCSCNWMVLQKWKWHEHHVLLFWGLWHLQAANRNQWKAYLHLVSNLPYPFLPKDGNSLWTTYRLSLHRSNHVLHFFHYSPITKWEYAILSSH